MNLLIRSNLLFKVVKAPVSGSDDKRLLRIYGSYVVIGRLMGNSDWHRLFLLNYGGAKTDVDGVRIRVLGKFPQYKANKFRSSRVKVSDYKATQKATELTLANLSDLTIVDLKQ